MSREIYTYTATETSEDTRTFTIKSDKKLTYDDVADIYQDSSLSEEDERKYIEYRKGVTMMYHGTSYGDSDSDIDGDFIEEEDNEK